MPRRGSRPSLYEVGQMRLSRSGQGLETDGASPSREDRPGRTSLRVPLGFMWMVVLGGIVLIVIAWAIGRGAGAEEARKTGVLSAAQMERVQDPLQVAAPPAPAVPPAAPPDPVPVPEKAAPEAATGDPMQSGLYYFVLAEWRPADMERMGDFCRSQGLDVAVVSGDNARLAKLIALPGLQSDRSSDPAVRALASKISSVGRLWKTSGGTTSFDDKYLMRKGD